MNLENAKAFLDRGDLAQAEEICRAVLNQDPNNAPALHLLGCVAFNAGQAAPGADLIKKAIALEPSNMRYQFELGEFLLRSGNFSDSEKYFTAVIDAEPGHAVAHAQKGNALSNGGRRKDAVEHWFRYVSLTWSIAEKDEGLPSEKSHPLNSSDLDCSDFQGDIRPYIICSTPRCGSTLLCDLLTQSGELGVPHEYLNISSHGLELMGRFGIDGSDPDLARTYLDTLKRLRTSPNGVFGLKAHHNQLNILMDPPLLNEVFPKVQFAQIVRRNRIAQAISFAIAFQTQQWDSTKKKENEPTYDAGLIDQCLAQILNQETEWTYFFQVNAIQPHVIHYEDLLEDSASVCRAFVDFAGFETDFEFAIKTSKFSRQSNQVNVDWENRYKSERGIFPG